MDKRCQNCEHYTGPREVKNGFLGVSVNAGYSNHSMCTKTNHKASAGMTCNCSHFEVWGKLQLELEKEKAKKEQAKHKQEAQREANRRKLEESRYHSSEPVSSSASLKKSVLSEAELKQGHKEYLERNYNDIKKLRVAVIILSIVNVLLLISGIVCKVIASNVIEANKNSTSYYAKQNIASAETTSTLGTILIILSIIFIIVPWLIWYVKYSKAKKELKNI